MSGSTYIFTLYFLFLTLSGESWMYQPPMLIRVFNFGFECAAWYHFYRNLRHRLHLCVNFGDDLRLDIYFSSYKGKSPRGPCQGPKKSIFWPFFGPSDHDTYYKILSFLLSKLQVHRDQIDMILGWYLVPILKVWSLKITIFTKLTQNLLKLCFSDADFSKLVKDINLKICLSDQDAPEVYSKEFYSIL